MNRKRTLLQEILKENTNARNESIHKPAEHGENPISYIYFV